MLLATQAQMSRLDAEAIGLGVAPDILMENAARAVLSGVFDIMKPRPLRSVAVFAGSGNNGGDGVACARFLLLQGVDVRVFLVGDPGRKSRDFSEMESRLRAVGGGVLPYIPGDAEIADFCERADVIIDAIFGTGLNAPLAEPALRAAELINSCPGLKVSADIASGVHSDTGRVLGGCVRADMTVTFTLAKPGHFLHPGAQMRGELRVMDIGIPSRLLQERSFSFSAVDGGLAQTMLPVMRPDSHKGDFGSALIVAGSRLYSGAAHLASAAAVKCGAGKVTLAVCEGAWPQLACKTPEVMCAPMPDSGGRLSIDALDGIFALLDKSDACAIGPGLGLSEDISELVFSVIQQSSVPLLLDADGINALCGNIDILRRARCEIVLTPHPGEFSRLLAACGSNGNPVPGESPVELAHAFAERFGVTLVLKGAGTVTACSDGRTFINTTGNAGMAKGGSGDVLSGVICAFLAQGLVPADAAALGAYVHGLAGDICAERIGMRGMTPLDTVTALPAALKNLEQQKN